MSSVFSKLLDRASARYGVRQETLTRGVVGAAMTLYLLKLGYPYVAARVARASTDEQQQQQRRQRSRRKNEEDREGRDNSSTKRNGNDRRRTNNNHNHSNNNNNNNGDANVVAIPDDAAAGSDVLAEERRQATTARRSVGLNRAFLRQLLMLLRIMVPGWRTREAGLLACATLTLLARTFLSVYVAELEGQIVKRIVLRDVRGFAHMIARWFAIALPATFVNSAIRYLEGRLALSFRYIERARSRSFFFLPLFFLLCRFFFFFVFVFFFFIIISSISCSSLKPSVCLQLPRFPCLERSRGYI